MQLRISGIQNDSIVDGPGFRYAVFTQGCPHHCPGCHNPQTHALDGGRSVDTETLKDAMRGNPLLDGLTLSGGEPFAQAEACAELARGAKEMGLNVWVYSGYTFEQLLEGAKENAGWRNLLEAADILVDGLFVQSQRTLELRFRGSRNQRLIDLPRAILQSEAVEWNDN